MKVVMCSATTVILLCQLAFSRSCLPGYYYGDYGSPSESETPVPTTDVPKLNRSKYSSQLPYSETRGGFRVPESELANWNLWLKKYKQDEKRQQLLLDMNKTHAEVHEKDRGPANGWPDTWANLGAGEAGFPPGEIPPWGYKPRYTGLPALCYTPTERGRCEDKEDESTMRWGFNVYTESCEQFPYSGCGGNANNFKEELKCTETCLQLDPGDCEFDTDLPIDEYTLRRSLTRKCT